MPKEMSNNWAIVVGINNYDFLPNAKLKFAALDALAVQEFLCKEAGFETKNVLLCGDGSEGSHRATRSVLRDLLLNQLQRAQNADNLWFFFSGHGMSGSDQQDYLMTIDGNPQDLHDTAIPVHFVTDRLRACKARNIVLVLDMCRNESRDPGQKNAESIETSLRQLVKARDGQQGIITLFSCGRGQSSYEIADLKQGAFTYALMEGLRRHTILKDLETYLAQRVPELHQAAGKVRKQVPIVIPEPGWKYEEPILSHYATAVDVVRLKEMAIDVESNGDFKKAIRLWEQVNLLAGDAGDRQRALSKIRDLMARIESLKATEPPLPALLKRSPVQSVPQSQSLIDAVSLESEKGVDYSNLRDLLKEERWEEADQETLRVMTKATNRENAGWLTEKNLESFPCMDLMTIDQLWITASNGYFGFSVQKKIWQDWGSPITPGRNWDRFCVTIGWQSAFTKKQYASYSELKKNPLFSPAGELPVEWLGWWDWKRGLDWGKIMRGSFPWPTEDKEVFSVLAERFITCSTR
jgi:GUN4-like/Caspase domain